MVNSFFSFSIALVWLNIMHANIHIFSTKIPAKIEIGKGRFKLDNTIDKKPDKTIPKIRTAIFIKHSSFHHLQKQPDSSKTICTEYVILSPAYTNLSKNKTIPK